MRWLHIIPTIHSDDENPLAQTLEYDHEEVNDDYHEENSVAQQHWDTIKESVLKTFHSYRGMKIFAEGVTSDMMAQFVSDEERKAISSHSFNDFKNQRRLYDLLEGNMAENQVLSPQLVLMIFLYSRGAEFVDCDDLTLLRRGLDLHKQFAEITFGEDDQYKPFSQEEVSEMRQIAYEFDEINDERDQKVANSINDKLEAGDHGILIFGADHNVQKYLAKDVKVLDTWPELRESMAQVHREIGVEEGVGMSTRFENMYSQMLEQQGFANGEVKG